MWLMANDRKEDAIKIFRKIAQSNNRDFNFEKDFDPFLEAHTKKEQNTVCTK